ncbi:hypothetical protein ES332_D11G342000v1 [Gossypium tomentosum]|uniref:Uncharacterized protein n=1 Tax=Gossypium tomentosum TaxID=34277 RepID=A0A5D2IXB5_GOSTO|nr:hypothetical protein ES332_D11G342000v1 [Gossypium tomentosum]
MMERIRIQPRGARPAWRRLTWRRCMRAVAMHARGPDPTAAVPVIFRNPRNF